MNTNGNSSKTDIQKCCNYVGVFTENEDVNRPDRKGNVPLHNAVLQDDVKLLIHLLHQRCVDPNIKNNNGVTPLQLAVGLSRSDAFIMHLIHAGSDLNVTNNLKQNLLHLAVTNSLVQVAQELIKNGIDINAQDGSGRTPLHYAVDRNNMEAICMLLYYKADVSIVCRSNMTPLTRALYCGKVEIAKTLFDYYDTFYDTEIDDCFLVRVALWQQSPRYSNSLETLLQHNRIEVFELIWSKLNHHMLLNNNEIPFLSRFLVPAIRFSAEEFVKLMYLVLESPVAFELFEQLNNFVVYDTTDYGCLFDIVQAFYTLEVGLDDRVKIIYACLNLGTELNTLDVNLTNLYFGFDEELEALLYCSDYNQSGLSKNRNKRHWDRFDLDSYPFPQCCFIFSLQKYLDAKNCFNSYLYMFRWIDRYPAQISTIQNCVLNNLGYSSIPFYWKIILLNRFTIFFNKYPKVLQKLRAVPELPSLLELSRNYARCYIMQTCKITKPYHYHDVVKGLKLPIRVQDILRFKTPLF